MLHTDLDEPEGVYPGLEKMRLSIKVKVSNIGHDNSDKKLITQKRVLEVLLKNVEKRHLPKYYAYETMRRLLLTKRWLYSYKHQIIELIWLLEESNDERLQKHIDYFCKEINYVKPL